MNGTPWQRSVVVAGAALVLFGSIAASAEDAPKPGPEHKKLEYYTGKWSSESEVKANPIMPSGKYSTKDDCAWFQGGFTVVCHTESSGPMGPMKSVGIMGYNSEEKVYTYYGIDSSGMTPTVVSRGSVQGDTWVYTDESKMGGKTIKSRYTMKTLSPTAYTFKWEMEGAGGTWSTLMEGKSTKAP